MFLLYHLEELFEGNNASFRNQLFQLVFLWMSRFSTMILPSIQSARVLHCDGYTQISTNECITSLSLFVFRNNIEKHLTK